MQTTQNTAPTSEAPDTGRKVRPAKQSMQYRSRFFYSCYLSLPNKPAGRIINTIAMMMNTTVADASG
jgi:hypothetical protein